MQVINKKIIVIFICISIFVFGLFKLFNKEKIELDNVILDINNSKDNLAIYVEDNKGNYVEYENNNFPKNGYVFNKELSGCIDTYGNDVKDILNFEEGIGVSINTNKTLYCYLYFDEKENIGNICSEKTMQECMNSNKKNITTIANLNADQAGLYRYQGTRDEVNNNYICFGTNDKEQCLNDTEHYMYRILGIKDNGQIKLIKNTPIKEGNTTNFLWYNDSQVKTIWGDSDLFKRLNGTHSTLSNIFINSTEYSYLKDSTWLNRIADSDWYQGFIRGGILNGKTAYEVYQMENGDADTTYTDLVGEITKSVTERFSLLKNAKIGLMYMTDYNYALQKDGYNCYGAGLKCSQNWLHIFGTLKTYEHIITAYGYYNGSFQRLAIYYNWSTDNDGYFMDRGNDAWLNRPVFFLVSTINLTGIGTIDNPYIIN